MMQRKKDKTTIAQGFSNGEKKLEQLSREYVLNYVLEHHTIEKVVWKMLPQIGDAAQDLIQDIYVIVWQLPTEKLFKLYLQKTLLNYVAQIVIFQVNTRGSQFNKTYENKIKKVNLDETSL